MQQHYLKQPTVQAFIKWFATNLTSNTFKHCYLNRRTHTPWQCSSLLDAYHKYLWPHPALGSIPAGNTSGSSAAVLKALQTALREALTHPHCDAVACTASIDVMRWGGVSAGNVRWLQTHCNGLAQTLDDTRTALNSGNYASGALADPQLRFNAGMTKVYALLCDDFIIYDSRVAAALGWAVVKFCHAHQLTTVPSELSFPWAPAKEAPGNTHGKRRDPSEGTLHFPRLKPGTMHAQWNLKASWLLSATMRHPLARYSCFHTLPHNTALRGLEAALFMIGYELPALNAHVTGTAHSNASNGSDEQDWIDCFTTVKHTPFRYRLTESSVEIYNGQSFSVAEINRTLQILWEHFGNGVFPLSNKADDVANGTAKAGLGVAYYTASGKPAPYTSRLAAMLQDLGLFIAQAQPKGWRLDTTILQLETPTSQVDVTRALEIISET